MNEIAQFSTAVVRLQGEMLKLPQAPCNVRHIFAPGIYMRELSVRADTYMIGHTQRFEHVNILSKGRVRIFNEDRSVTELSAPLTFIGKPGKKVGYVVDDIVWTNVYATDETDIETLEETFLDRSDCQVPLIEYKTDGDFSTMLEEIGVSAERMRAESENEADQCPFPPGTYKVKVGRSGIEGRGLIATSDITAGEVICPAGINGRRTPAGRYTNHSKDANAAMIHMTDGIYLMAKRNIAGSLGGQDGEEITVDYRHVPRARLST
jgi:hypothetical protein